MPYPPNPIQFRTFPDPRLQSGSRLRFIASSCMVPNFPYRGPFHRRTIRGYDLLAKYLNSPTKSPKTTKPLDLFSNTTQNNSSSTTKRPNSITMTDFLLFLGDFIYADVPLYIGDNQEAYRSLYRRNYQSPSFRNVYEKLRKYKFSVFTVIVDNKHRLSDLPYLRRPRSIFYLILQNRKLTSPLVCQQLHWRRDGRPTIPKRIQCLQHLQWQCKL